MYHEISQLLMYGDLSSDEILYNLGVIFDKFESGNYSKMELVRDINTQVKRLLKVATDYGFDDNLWHNYLTFYIMMNENPFSMTCEKVGASDGSVNNFVENDFKIFKKLFDYDFSTIEAELGISCFTQLCNYKAIVKKELMYNKNVSEKVRALSKKLEAALHSIFEKRCHLEFLLDMHYEARKMVAPEQLARDYVPGAEVDEEAAQRKAIFFVGVGGLVFVPIFRYLTNLPPFVGILLVLGCLWTLSEIFYRNVNGNNDGMSCRVIDLIRNIDMGTILFFLGILMAVACLEEVGVLHSLGSGLNVVFNGNHFMVTGIIGVLSSIVDNVPLVAGCMGMYPIQAATDFATDGVFWQLLAYCAGVGGSMLIIGSAAGVVVMGLEKITFGWYMKHITWIAFVGYIAGILSYYVLREFIFTTPL